MHAACVSDTVWELIRSGVLVALGVLRSFQLRSGIARWVLLIGLLGSGIGFLFVRNAQRSRAEARFREAVVDAQGRLEDRLRVSEDLLRTVQGFVRAGGDLNRRSYRELMEAMGVPDRYPGLQAIAYGVPVAPGGREQVEARLRTEHQNPLLRIHPGTGFEGDAAILFEEPEAPNIAALGFNSASAPQQRAPLLAARDTGEVRASAPMKLAQAPQAGPGFILRLALYGRECPLDVPSRRQTFSGYVNAVFLLNQFAEDSATPLAARCVGLTARDATEPEQPQALFARTPDPRPGWSFLEPAGFWARSEMKVAGRVWILEFHSGRGFFSANEVSIPWFTALSVVLMTLLLAALVHATAQTGERAQRLAERMTSELSASEARMRALTALMPDAVLLLDEDGRYVDVLTQDPENLAAPREQLLGRLVDEFLAPELAQQVVRTIRKSLQERRVQSMEYSLPTPKGLTRFEARVAPMDLVVSERPCVIWVARDVTERQTQEDALRQAQKLESLGVLAGGIAHDFNNLLAAIQGYLGLAQLATNQGKDPSNHLERMETSIRRAAELARELLAYSGRGSFQIEPMDLNRLVQEMGSLLSISRSKNVELKETLQPNLPAILGDRAQMQQVVMNLVTNASEAIGDQPGLIEITTRVRDLDKEAIDHTLPGQNLEPGSFVELAVRDTGCGMSEDTLEKIYDPFFTTKPSGRGLGLSAIRGILRAHGAGVEIKSELGCGTTFRICLPMVHAPVPPPESEPATRQVDPLSGKVLLAEDEPMIRDSSRLMAEHLGFEVIEAADGEEAWQLFLMHESDLKLVVLDLTMPKRSGTEVYSLIRDRAPRIPILLCSGYSRESIPSPLSLDEPRLFLQKPFTFAQLGESLRDLATRA